MPQIIPFVVTAITAVTSAVVAAGPLAVAAFNAANIIGAGLLANEAFKAVQPQVKSSSTAIEWNADPNAPNRFAFGRIGGAGNIIHNATYGPDKMFVGFVGVMSASGPIKSWVAFKADDAFVSFDGGGKAITSDYAGEMYLGRQRGLQPEPSYLPSPSGLKNGAAMPRWRASYKLSGKAAYHYTLAENSKRSAYKGKVPTGIHTVEGLFCYDPRLDSTYPGGLGPCRLDDPTTWIYSTNAYIHGLNWAIGRWEGEARGFTPKRYGVPYASMKVGGIGAHPDGIDFAGYVEGANVFDENFWACAAWPDADQGKGAVLDSFLQAGGGIYAERQGKISCLHRAAPRTSVATITADDTAGTIEYDTTTSLLERINTIRPEYWSEAHGWQMIATDEVSAKIWREEDGQGVEVTRSKGLAFNFVPGSKQARELAALQIAHTREGIRGTAPLRHYLDLEVGDCFTFQVPEAVLNGLKCIVLNVDPDLENDIINVTFASESDGKYPFAFGQADAPPPAPGLQPADNTVSPPLPGDWVIVPRPPGPGGTLVPGFDLSGVVGNSTATAIEVQWWEVPDGVDHTAAPPADAKWQSAGTWPPTASDIPINVPGGRYYWIGLIHVRNQNYSERALYGPYFAGELVAVIAPDAPVLEDIRAEARAKAALLIKEAASRWNRDETDKRFGIQNFEYVSEQLLITRQTLELADENQIALLEVERTARIDGITAETEARQLQISGVESALAIVDTRSATTATALTAETSTRTSQVSSLGASLSIVDGKATTAASTASAAAAATTALSSKVDGVEANATLALSTAADAKGQIGDASFAVEVAAGGDPAMIYARAKGSTSVAGMVASVLRFANTVSGTMVEAMRLVAGEVFFMRPIYIDVGAKRLIVGPGSNWVMWFGPNTINAASATRTNGHWAFGSDGKVYYGSTELGTGGGSLGATASPDLATGSAPGGGVVTSNTVTITVTGPGAASAVVRWVKTEEVGGTIDVYPSGKTAYFRATVPPGGMVRALYLAVVSYGGLSVTVLVDVQLTDSI